MDISYTRCDRLPVSVNFMSTYNCNTVCEHCDVWRYKEDELTTGEVKGMVRELKKLGTRYITFDGGEPLTRPDIGELVDFCTAEGVMTALNTNGLLLERCLPKLSRLARLSVSLLWSDGQDRVESAYRVSLEAIRAAKRAGIDAEACVLLTRTNISALPAILDDCSSCGARLRLKMVARRENSADNSRIGSVIPGSGELNDALRYLAERMRRGAEVVAAFAQSALKDGAWCSFEERSFVVSPSGDVAPCQGLLGLRKWPNGRSLGFRAAFRKAEEFYCPSEAFTLRAACNL